jgi:hypothetical protein
LLPDGSSVVIEAQNNSSRNQLYSYDLRAKVFIPLDFPEDYSSYVFRVYELSENGEALCGLATKNDDVVPFVYVCRERTFYFSKLPTGLTTYFLGFSADSSVAVGFAEDQENRFFFFTYTLEDKKLHCTELPESIKRPQPIGLLDDGSTALAIKDVDRVHYLIGKRDASLLPVEVPEGVKINDHSVYIFQEDSQTTICGTTKDLDGKKFYVHRGHRSQFTLFPVEVLNLGFGFYSYKHSVVMGTAERYDGPIIYTFFPRENKLEMTSFSAWKDRELVAGLTTLPALLPDGFVGIGIASLLNREKYALYVYENRTLRVLDEVLPASKWVNLMVRGKKFITICENKSGQLELIEIAAD